ncbi:ThiF family adenylyltransferase [Pseudomonas lalucatii]|nr:ThiF family adenylyltransferase [Pseudomonas lalucatii]
MYMRERGGASLELLGKQVAVLGCGAVGSVVADALAAAGVGKLILVDQDEYSKTTFLGMCLTRCGLTPPRCVG